MASKKFVYLVFYITCQNDDLPSRCTLLTFGISGYRTPAAFKTDLLVTKSTAGNY